MGAVPAAAAQSIRLLQRMKKAAAVSGNRLSIVVCSRERLPLRELERAAGFGLAVFLALDHAAVAGEEAALFQSAARVGSSRKQVTATKDD